MREYIQKLVDRQDLSESEAAEAMRTIMSGKATQAQMGSFLTALRMKGESVSDVTAFARIMREFGVQIHPRTGRTLVDMCGTGGDTIKTFNISTIASFVVAGAGVPVAKHGNRSVTSKSGSADVLEALGARIDLPPAAVEQMIEEIGFGFMFAPVFHASMKHAVSPRKEVGIRTVFNLLGPTDQPGLRPGTGPRGLRCFARDTAGGCAPAFRRRESISRARGRWPGRSVDLRTHCSLRGQARRTAALRDRSV